jgi:hypothetical protein
MMVTTSVQKILNGKLFDKLIDVVTKANLMLNVMYDDKREKIKRDLKELSTRTKDEQQVYREKHNVIDVIPAFDSLKYVEMQLNKTTQILNKAKLICLKLDKVFVVIPYTYSKIELRTRNIIINHRPTLDAISHFMNFYLINKNFHDHLMDKYSQYIKYQEELRYEASFKKGPRGGKNSVIDGNVSSSNLLVSNPAAPQGSNNYTTNYSSNMPPP